MSIMVNNGNEKAGVDDRKMCVVPCTLSKNEKIMPEPSVRFVPHPSKDTLTRMYDVSFSQRGKQRNENVSQSDFFTFPVSKVNRFVCVDCSYLQMPPQNSCRLKDNPQALHIQPNITLIISEWKEFPPLCRFYEINTRRISLSIERRTRIATIGGCIMC